MSFVLLHEKCLERGLERGLENFTNMMIVIVVIMFLCWFYVPIAIHQISSPDAGSLSSYLLAKVKEVFETAVTVTEYMVLKPLSGDSMVTNTFGVLVKAGEKEISAV